jgi:hypothetical protein
MKVENFVAGLVHAVHEPSVSDTIAMLEAGPSGRRPQARLVELSGWYRGLSPQDQLRVRQVLELGVHSALFGALCVIDGARPLEGSTDFALYAVTEANSVQLNALNEEALHHEYQGQVYERVFGLGA